MLIVCVKACQVNKIDHSDFSLFFSEENKRKRCPFLGLHKASLPSLAPQMYSAGADWRRITWPDGRPDEQSSEETLLLGHGPG